MASKQLNRRYSLAMGAQLIDPAHAAVALRIADGAVHNPANLKHDACKVARALAHAMACEVTVVKHLRSGDRDEARYTPGWNA